MEQKGFTLVEVLTVIVLMSIVALGSISYFTSTISYSVETAAEQLVQELRGARAEALSRNVPVDLYQVDNGSFIIRELNNDLTPHSQISRRPFHIGNSDQISFAFNGFTNNSARRVIFNNRGRVVNIAGNQGRISVSGGNKNIVLTINPNTGYISR